jgi:hypothetical protein
MVNMKRPIFLAIAAAALLVPAAASADIVELGSTKTALVAPSCPANVTPANCTIILTEVTALETLRDGLAYPTTASKPGQIVAFTLGLSRLSTNRTTAKNDVHFLNHTYGGTAQASITVLRRTGSPKTRRFVVVGQSEIKHLQPYLGQVVQFPLATSLPVAKGDLIGLTVPTWAPVLSIQLPGKKFAYRQGRSANCNNPPATNQALGVNQSARFLCNYAGTRVEYTATEVTNPVSINPIKTPDQGF